MSNLLEFVAAVVRHLPDLGEQVRQKWIENPQALFKVLAGALHLESRIWKTIKIGTIKTADEFRKAIGERGMKISDSANEILGEPEFFTVARETEVDLVRVSVGELGFKKGARIDQIYARAKELGLELCPPEVGPQLRLQYQEQPKYEQIFIGMKPIPRHSTLITFSVDDDAALCLEIQVGYSNSVWGADEQGVFIRPRK